MKPTLPDVPGARYVGRDEASFAYEALGFRLPDEKAPRCLIPNQDRSGSGAVFTWDGKRWRIESGYLSGTARRAWVRWEAKRPREARS